MRVTKKYLIKWVNEEFKRLEINDWEVFQIDKTRFRSQDYEEGACFLYVRFRFKENHTSTARFLCFYPLKEYEEHINNGKKLKLTFGRSFTLTDCTIEIINP